ncbi:MAG TPA: metal ABC transporter permease [Thermoleophilia bacterium]|nr:metal ABC transporter permease [Thermoleophilia bacterium]
MSQIGAALPGLGWLLDSPFMRNAFLAGTLIALACGLVGYFLVLRAQVFTSDALSHVAFTAALGALAFGLDPRLGLFAGTILVALAMAALGRRASADDVVIGSTFAWVLGLGVLFLTLYTTQRSTANGVASVNYLFGSIFGLSTTQAASAALVAAAISAGVVVIARPLLFASLDEAVAAAAGVPVRLLGVVFLVLVAATTAEATQAVGALLVLGLVAAPAGAAQQLTARPYRALGLSVTFSLGAMWLGLTASYLAPRMPPSFAIIAVASLTYLLATIWASATRGRLARRSGRHPATVS